MSGGSLAENAIQHTSAPAKGTGALRTTAGLFEAPHNESLEHQNRARDLAGLHRAKCFVHVLEPAAPSDHLVQAQQAALVEVDVLRHVDLEAVRAHAAALDALLAEEDAALELELLTDRDHADDRGGTARTDALEALLGRLLEADRLEGVLDAAVGHLPNGFDWIDLRGIHGVGRAELLGLRELVLEHVDR